jgi:transcriptional regulator with XRE-family HTH domain
MPLLTGEFIGYFRNETGFSQKKFSEEFSVALASLHKWEHGEHLPSIETMKKVFKYCKDHHIEIYDYSWEAYIDEILFTYDFGMKYERLSNLDESTQFFVLRCKDCNHESAIPLHLIDPQHKGILCMNCWLEKHPVDSKKYYVNVQEDIGHVEIRCKKCGHHYFRDLAELKKDGFACDYLYLLKQYH